MCTLQVHFPVLSPFQSFQSLLAPSRAIDSSVASRLSFSFHTINSLLFLSCLFRYRLTIAGKTCVFQKQNDPTKLRWSCMRSFLFKFVIDETKTIWKFWLFICPRSLSAGKLICYTVEDGGHVFQGETYAEIEVP